VEYRLSGGGAEGLTILPGALGGADALGSLLEGLSERYRLVLVEYPVVSGLDELLSGLSSLLAREGIRRTALLGGSFGGLVAQAFLFRFPEATTRVVLSATGPPDPRRARTNERFLRVVRFLPMSLVRSLLRLGIRRMVKRAPRDRERWLSFYSNLVDGFTRERLSSLYKVAIDFDRLGPDRLAALESWQGEMLLLAGSEDRVASKRSREALKSAYPRARSVTIEGAGHGMALEKPDEWRGAVTSFLLR
jgi:pimeloyl-ACP methyl ester carboxylesterase